MSYGLFRELATLDEAWAEAALAADDRGWRLLEVKENPGSGGGWLAIASPGGRGVGLTGKGRTPNDALIALAAILSGGQR